MGGLKTLLVGLLLVALLPGRSLAIGDLPSTFADCTGRFSAAMEHAWLVQDPRADEFEGYRDAFEALLDAVAGPADRDLLARRIDAKAAQARLLLQARFGGDGDESDWARTRAGRHLATCRMLLLGG